MTVANDTGRRITTSEAQLKTAAIEIKTVQVGGKQMTLAVFRQLIEQSFVLALLHERWVRACSDLMNIDGPIAWGYVNYHGEALGCAPGDGEHVHIVWQQGCELRRSCIWRIPDSPLLNVLLNDPFHERWRALSYDSKLSAWQTFYDHLVESLDQLFIAV